MTEKANALMRLKAECIACRKCAIGGCVYENCPGNVFSSMSMKADIMVVGQNPGAVEVKTGKPFVGPSGANFDKAIKEVLGYDRSDFYISNSIRCFSPNNRAPTREEIENCRPFLEREIAIIKPSFVVTLGSFAMFQLTGLNGIEKHQGKIVQSARYGVNVLILYHPSPLNLNQPVRREAFYKGLATLKTYLWVVKPNGG